VLAVFFADPRAFRGGSFCNPRVKFCWGRACYKIRLTLGPPRRSAKTLEMARRRLP
jgi:hypothetical protein